MAKVYQALVYSEGLYQKKSLTLKHLAFNK